MARNLKKDQKVYTVSSVKSLLSCKGFKNNPKGSLAMTRGSLLHSMLEMGIEDYDKKGSEYRGTYRPYNFLDEINLDELEDTASVFMDEHPEYFTNEWTKEQEIHCTTKSGYQISGIVDSMVIRSTSASLIDFKSGISRADIRNELDMLQAVWYSYIIFKTKPTITDVAFSFIYIEADDQFININFNINDLSKMEAMIERFIFATKYTGLRVNNKCKWCNERDTCVLLALEAQTLEKFGIKKVKDIKGACEASIKDYKENKLQEARDSEDFKGFTTVVLHYIKTDQLSTAEKLTLIKDEIKITKKKSKLYEAQGKIITKKNSYRMR